MLVLLPFSGFYESAHDDIIDREIESAFEDESGVELDGAGMETCYEKTDFKKVRIQYVKEYVEHYAHMLAHETDLMFDYKPKMKLRELVSPRFYNYETDKIVAHVTKRTVKTVYDQVMKSPHLLEAFEDRVRGAATMASGYTPYSSTVRFAEGWADTPVTEWEPQYLGMLFDAVLDDHAMDQACYESDFTESLDLDFWRPEEETL